MLILGIIPLAMPSLPSMSAALVSESLLERLGAARDLVWEYTIG